jgi:hypothetical protein
MLREADFQNDCHSTDTPKSQARRCIAVQVRIVAKEEQTLPSFGFEQHLLRHPLAFALQILDQPVDGLDNTPA